MRKVSESGFETGLGPAMRGQTGLETAPDNRTVTRFTYAPEQKVRVLSQTLDSTDRLDALSRQSLRQGKGQVSAFRVARGPTQGAERPEPGTTLIRTCCRCRCRNWLV